MGASESMADPSPLPAGAEGSAPAESDAARSTGDRERPEGRGLYRLLVDSVQDYAIFALDPQGVIISWNAGAQRLKGYEPQEIIGRHFSTFYPPADIADGKPARELKEAAERGRVEDEGWRLRNDGTRFWANVVITALRDDSGELVGFAKVTRDLTDRRHAEETLRTSEERFRLLVEGVKDYAIFMLDPRGNVVSWNRGAEAITGYRAEEILGRHFSTFYPAADVSGGKPPWELEVALREGQYEEEGWRVRKDGSCFWSSVLITAIRGAGDRLIGFAKVTRDLTERRAAQERMIADARRIAQVEASSRTKSEFLTSLSHELRTPINATLGYADLLDLEVSGPLGEQQREYIRRIRGSQEHLLRIITDLLNYSRIESGRVEFELTEVTMNSIVEKVLPMVEPQAAAKDLAITYRPQEDPSTALADRARAEQIVLNLLANAVKFTPAGGRVEVTCARTADRATVVVADTGPGVPLEQQNAIFEPFVQIGRSLTSGHEGTGLGLAISRDLARGMGGDVSVVSGPDAGATFTLSLPLH
jgi:PAS domain S-box-containing protein